MIRRDVAESVVNAAAGLAISTAIVWVLRALGLWDLPAPAVVAIFAVASAGRAFALRRVFRRGERP